MTLEPVMPALDEEENPELRDFARRFWWSLPLTVIVTVLAMAGHFITTLPWLDQNWIEFALATPVTLWAGWPFL
jgi:Cu+-exporting ATPase